MDSEHAAFTDRAGRRWALELTYGLAKKIAKETGFSFLALNEKALDRLVSDEDYLVDVVWRLVADQAAADGVTREQFEASLDRETLTRILQAIAEALVNFSRPDVRPAVEALMKTIWESKEQAGIVAKERILGPKVSAARQKLLADLGRQIEEQFTKSLAGMSSPSAGPESPASTPDPSASAS